MQCHLTVDVGEPQLHVPHQCKVPYDGLADGNFYYQHFTEILHIVCPRLIK